MWKSKNRDMKSDYAVVIDSVMNRQGEAVLDFVKNLDTYVCSEWVGYGKNVG